MTHSTQREPGIVRAGPLWMFVAKPGSSNSVGELSGQWQRVVCTLRSNGYFSQADAETGVLGDLLNMRDRTRRDARLVDDSVLDRRHCFSIRGPLGITFYAADNRATRLAWCTLLKQAATEEMESRITALIASLNLQETSTYSSNNRRLHNTSGIRQTYSDDDDRGKGIDVGVKGIQGADQRARAVSVLEADKFRIERRLQIRINEARKLQLDDRRCWISVEVGDEFHSRTCAVDGPEPSWGEEYTINDIPGHVDEARLVVYSRSKHDKNARIGVVRVPLGSLPKVQPFDNWYPIVRDPMDLTSVNLAGTHLGDVRLRLRYEELVVLPAVAYEELSKILLEDEPLLVIAIAGVTRNLDWLAERLVLTHQANHRAVEWLQFLAAHEVTKTGDANILFRGNSLTTKAIDAYMKLVGWQYLDDTIGGALRYICANRVCCEMDSSRMDNPADVTKNGEELKSYAQMIWRAIEASIEECPMELRRLFAHIQRQVMEKHSVREGTSPNVRYTCVSGFLFLRLFCPAVLSPRLFDLVPEHPDAGTQRTLTLLAKTLQCLGNIVEFGAKETFMIPMNSFIQENINGFKHFVDKLAGVEPFPERARDQSRVVTLNGRQRRRRGLIFNKQRRPLSESSISGTLTANLQQPVPASLDDLSTQPALPYMIDPDRELAAIADYVHTNKERLIGVVSELDEARGQQRQVTSPTMSGRTSSLVRTCDPAALCRLINICEQIHARVLKTKQL
ncbi:Rho GTPase activation protein [Syncephalis fuscata]|nr:Rho GTPase activation protein [Syncephalis fuscata]KAI9590930.1 Rho GTPase activation protein [Syncephalis fuscata]